MEKNSNYIKHRPDGNVTCEPATEYHAMEGDVAYLPDDILVAALKCADISRKRGDLVPHDKVYATLAQRLGWK